MNKTANYQLNQWEAEDRVVHEDFNADNQKIDAAIKAVALSKADASALEALKNRVDQVAAAVPQIIFGTYTGDGKPSQDIVLGFQPKALVVFRAEGCASFVSNRLHSYGGLAYPGQSIANGYSTALEITENGFRVYYNTDQYIFCNAKYEFRYMVFM